MKILVTGCAGFIGFHVCKKLLELKNVNVVGLDNLNKYYDVKLKKERVKILKKNNNDKFEFNKVDLLNLAKLKSIFKKNNIKYVINLAAQAGVRYSISNPDSYLKSNIVGFYNILECSRIFKIKHLIYASTSSVYGDSKKFPLKENYNTDLPLSLYAATKKSNEVMAHSYSYIYKIPCTGLRFFTVYGPYGRPDMSLFKFTDSIIKSKKISLFNHGDHVRDFTYVDDVAASIIKLIRKSPKEKIPYSIYNIGSNNPQPLKKFLTIIENVLNKKAKIKSLPMQLGDVHKTHANVDALSKKIKYKPKTKINKGIRIFTEWYIDYFKK